MRASSEMIDQARLKQLLAVGGVRATRAVRESSGWQLRIQYGSTECALAARRGAVRVFRRFETLADFLGELGIVTFQVDATHYDSAAVCVKRTRSDASARLKAAHAAAAHDAWFRARVAQSMAGLADESNPVIDDADWAAEVAQWEREAAGH